MELTEQCKPGYDELYSTAPDVFERKIKALDKVVEERAVELANQTIEKVKSAPEQIAAEKERNLEILVEKMAQIILEENKQYVGDEIAEKAIEEIKKSQKKGESANEEVKKKSARGRKKQTNE